MRVLVLILANKVLNPQGVFRYAQQCCAYPLKWGVSMNAYV